MWVHRNTAYTFPCVLLDKKIQTMTPKMLLGEIIDSLGKIILRSYVERTVNLSLPVFNLKY